MIPCASSLQFSASFWSYSPAFSLYRENNTSDPSVKLLSACEGGGGLKSCGWRSTYDALSGAADHGHVNQYDCQGKKSILTCTSRAMGYRAGEAAGPNDLTDIRRHFRARGRRQAQ